MTARGAALAAAGCAVAGAALFRLVDTVHGIDLRVYYEAGRDALTGGPLYAGPRGEARVPFTYPPFAALPAALAALLPWGVLQWLWAVAGLCALAFAVAVGFRGVLAGRRRPALWLAGITAVSAATVPVTDHLGYGQVGLLIMAACLADADPAVRLPRRLPRGVLTGCAAAVKLVPAAYLVPPLVRGRGRTVLAGAAAFAACTAAALVLLPGPTAQYVSHVLPGLTGRVGVGEPAAAGNQSVRGALLRLLPGADGAAVTGTWLTVCLLLAPAAALCIARAGRFRGPVAALVSLALCVEAALPVAWTHHYVWLVPAVGLLLGPGAGRASRAAALCVTVAALARTAPAVARWSPGLPVLDTLGTEAVLLAAAVAVAGLATRPAGSAGGGAGGVPHGSRRPRHARDASPAEKISVPVPGPPPRSPHRHRGQRSRHRSDLRIPRTARR